MKIQVGNPPPVTYLKKYSGHQASSSGRHDLTMAAPRARETARECVRSWGVVVDWAVVSRGAEPANRQGAPNYSWSARLWRSNSR